MTTNRKRSCLLAEPYIHTTKWFYENVLGIEKNKTEIKMKSVFFGCG